MNKIFSTSIIVSALSFVSFSALAAQGDLDQSAQDAIKNERYYSIESVQTSQVDPLHTGISISAQIFPDDSADTFDSDTVAPPVAAPAAEPSLSDLLDQGNVVLDKIILLGTKVWKLIEAGKPVLNWHGATAAALPDGVKDWKMLSDWKPAESRVYRTLFKNGFGMSVVDFTYRVVYTSGGTANGKGSYLSNVTVQPAYVSVMWGYSLDVEADIPNVVNLGSKESPEAGMQVDVKWNVSTILKKTVMSSGYFISGKGKFVDLTQGTAVVGTNQLR